LEGYIAETDDTRPIYEAPINEVLIEPLRTILVENFQFESSPTNYGIDKFIDVRNVIT